MTDKDITVIITSSPCKRHPSAEMIQETIGLVRHQLPEASILILLDGVKPEQKYLRDAYNEYKSKLYQWTLAQPDINTLVFDTFHHQTGMLKTAIHNIDTKLILFIEHDFPVVGEIPWNNIGNLILNHEVELVRFYLEDRLIPEHRHMFLNHTSVTIGDVPLIKTSQWSQRPHLASTRLYRKIASDYIQNGQKTYIEDAIHGFFAYDFTKSKNASADWAKHKLAIYHPEGNISRCKHLDGRMEEKKYGLE